MKALPSDSKERKEYPLYQGVLRYFPAALAGVARNSRKGNLKHNPGAVDLVWDRSKSDDHADCILRHLTDLAELLVNQRATPQDILSEADAIAWRALALSQTLYEDVLGLPLAPAVKAEYEDRLDVVREREAFCVWAEAQEEEIENYGGTC